MLLFRALARNMAPKTYCITDIIKIPAYAFLTGYFSLFSFYSLILATLA